MDNIPSEYHDLKHVFSKERAQSLPPHCLYDCAIDLLPRATLPTKKMYNISCPERLAMEKNLSASLAAGLICTSSSPAGAGLGLWGPRLACHLDTIRRLTARRSGPTKTWILCIQAHICCTHRVLSSKFIYSSNKLNEMLKSAIFVCYFLRS